MEKKLALAVVISTLTLAIGLSTRAKAASITETSGYLDAAGTPTATNYTNKPVVPDLKQFNQAALGELTEVDILVTGTFIGVVNLQSFDASPIAVTVALGSTVSLNLPTVSAFPISLTVPTTTTTQNLNPGESVSFPLINTTVSQSFKLSLLLDDLSAFIGTGTIPATLSGLANSSVSESSLNISFSGAVKAGGTVTLTYDYVPVPEPLNILGATTGLVLFGTVSTALKRRKLTK